MFPKETLDTLHLAAAAMYELPPNIASFFAKRVLPNHALNLLEDCKLLLSCESPIEQMLLVELLHLGEVALRDLPARLCIRPQFEVQHGSRKYRVDLHVAMSIFSGASRVAVECDGHDFHEKTKDQAKRDKARDRDFQKLGIPVLRFTGSEIWNNVEGCALEIFNFLLQNSPKGSEEG